MQRRMPIQQCIWTRIQTTWKLRSKFNFGKSLISCPNEWKSLEMKTIFSHLVNCETLSTITACCYFSKIFNYICVCVLHQYMLCYLKKRKKKNEKTASILCHRQCLLYSNQEVQISVHMDLDRRMAKGDVSSNRLAIICLGVHHA